MFISEAWAQAAGGGGSAANTILQIVPFVAIFVAFYFLMIRPQQQRMKKHQEMVGAARRGDVVVTAGGLVGKVTRVYEDEGEVEIQLADNVKVRCVRSTLADVRSKTEPAKDEKSA